MRRNSWSVFAALIGMLALVFGSQTAGAQGKPEGKIVRSYRAADGGRPAWVDAALTRSQAYLRANGAALGLRDADAELALLGADEDDLGQTHVRMQQVKDGVAVFGAQLLTHQDANGVLAEVGGATVDVAAVDTKPALNPAQALKAAREALGYQGDFANKPEAALTILPSQDGAPGAKLAYAVELLVEDGTDRTGRYRYFVDAQSGAILLAFNDMDTVTGSGRSLYSGTVGIETTLVSGSYRLQDGTRGSMLTYTMRNTTTQGYYLTDADNVWGTGTNSDEDTAGVDAHFGAAKTWDYYLSAHGRRGIDGNGYRVQNRVHYGRNYNNAFWNGTLMTYGDGDGSSFSPLVSIDVVGHEITHGLTERTANLVYQKESGASNESFSDIFGTAVEYYTGSVGGRTADYLIGEDIYTPATAGDALRSMSNPAAYGDPDHYSKRLYPEPCTPSSTNDNCGVHSNSGIQNQAFWLLSAGGTNRTSGLSVTGIGRTAAERIFFRALTVKLTSSANFKAVRTATLSAAADLYGAGSTQYNATAAAWTAVGVQ